MYIHICAIQKGNKIFICPNDSSLFLILITPFLKTKKFFHPVRNPQTVPLVAPGFALAITSNKPLVNHPPPCFCSYKPFSNHPFVKRAHKLWSAATNAISQQALNQRSSVSFLNIQTLQQLTYKIRYNHHHLRMYI